MSLQQAIDEIRARLNALSGLHEVDDLRSDTLEESAKGNIHGAYNLRVVGTGNPWPDMALSPTSWWVQIEMELATLVHNDHVATAVQETLLTQEIRKALHYTALTYGTVWDFVEPVSGTSPVNPKLRIWRWRWKLRYEE